MSYLAALIFTVFAYMSCWFLVSLVKKRNDVADVAWGLGFILLAWTSYGISSNFAVRGLLVGILVTIWGSRLAWHIYRRNRGKPEDYRYLAWRQAWGKWFYVRSYFQVYLLQGALLMLIAAPIIMINSRSGIGLGWLDLLGALVWVTGFIFEAVGDAQLASFMKNPANKGKLMQSGLWAYTRHPNYFGEIVQWWGIGLMAVSVPYGFIGIIGPITISFLIVKVSGVPLLEKKMATNPEFLEYSKKVNMLFPLPRKSY